MTEIMFCYSGVAGFVVKQFDDYVFMTAETGDFMGLVDLVPSPEDIDRHRH